VWLVGLLLERWVVMSAALAAAVSVAAALAAATLAAAALALASMWSELDFLCVAMSLLIDIDRLSSGCCGSGYLWRRHW